MPRKGQGIAEKYSKIHGKPFEDVLYNWYWNDGLSQREIAEKIGTTTSHVSRLFKSYQIPKRIKNYWCYGSPAIYQVTIANKTHDVTGKMISKQGYVKLCIPSHPYSGKDRYIFEHRVVKEIELGRYLEPSEIVHHINEIKGDNRPENLQVMNRGEHTTLHHIGLKKNAEVRKKISIAAKNRLKNKEKHPSYKNVDEQIKQLIKSGKKPTEISRKLNITRKTVYNKIDYLGLKEMYKNA